MTKTLITGGRIVTAVDDYVADILLENGRIEAIARQLNVTDAERHDASGCLVLPGGIDVHTHMEGVQGPAVNCDSYETGTIAAAF
ncbi:MAG: dihydropyrimidinase, partial [Spirulinaceae cyanobacterium RM2_2_10]|nr:dihydropyrimidinase [Spirulinaceae cyanobacterium RM2_2_10]